MRLALFNPHLLAKTEIFDCLATVLLELYQTLLRLGILNTMLLKGTFTHLCNVLLYNVIVHVNK